MSYNDFRRVWVCDWGEFELPQDFPHHVLKKNGWWDRRFNKERKRAMALIEAETNKLRAQYHSE